jgi:tryptophanyl-tRNA synthetase
MNNSRKRLLTGLQPSGTLHIGNYFGALKPFIDIYEDYESIIMIADYHALTSLRDPDTLRHNTVNIVKDYLAAGIDPEKAIVFKQSDNPDHTELAWMFNCMVTVPFLMQAHSYKDKVAKGVDPNAGLFTYPMLQAADIALYNTDFVPVGEDQRQHLEYTREAIGKVNRCYGTELQEPQEMILEHVGVVPGTDGQKMSKSYGNTIPLFGSSEEIEKAVMSIVTDSTGERPENVYAIHKLIRPEAELESVYNEHKGRYGDIKKILAKDLNEFFTPMKEVRDTLSESDVLEVLENGKKQAKKISNETLQKVKQTVGIL